jgi:cell shape-determining protein MreC
MLFTWFTLGALIILLIPDTFTSKFQFAFARVFHLPLSVGRNLQLSQTEARPGNEQEIHIANLEKWLYYYRQEVENVTRMRQEFPLRNFALLPATITTVSEGPASQFYVNRGSQDAVVPGQFVMAQNGIIGTVHDVAAHSARVKLITDPESKIPVQIGSLPGRKMMTGKNGKTASIGMVPVKQNVAADSRVYVAPRVGFLDDPVIAGIVTHCSRDIKEPHLWDITVEPVAKIDHLGSVHILVFDPNN